MKLGPTGLGPHTKSRAEFNNSMSREQLIQRPGSEKFATEPSSAWSRSSTEPAPGAAALFQFNLDPGVKLLFLFKVKYKLAAVSEQCLGPSSVPSVASWCCCCVIWVASITCHVSACVAHRSRVSPRHLSHSTYSALASQSDAEKHNQWPIRGLRNHKLLETFILSIMGEPGEERNPCLAMITRLREHKIENWR